MEGNTDSPSMESKTALENYDDDALLALLQHKIIEGEDWNEAERLATARLRRIVPALDARTLWINNRFSWPKYFECEFKMTRSRTCFDNVLISLMKRQMVTIEDFIPYCKVFKVVVRLATDPQYSAVLHNFAFIKETLAERIIATPSNIAKKDTKIKELEYLERNGLIVPHQSTYSAAFQCLETRQMRLIKFFLGVPGLANYKRNGRNFWSYSKHHICPSWLKYFSKHDLKVLMLENFPDPHYFKMARPSRMLEIVQDLAIKNERALIPALNMLGDVAERFVNQYLPPSQYPPAILLRHGRTVRRLTKPVPAEPKQSPAGFEPRSSFPLDQLPAELLLMVCEHLESPDLVALFGISKALKAMEGDVFYRCVYKKEYPMIYHGLVSHSQPILLSDFNELNKRRENWRKGKFSVSYYKWKDYGLVANSKTEVKAIDENWAVALNDEEIFLWNCHDHQQHTLFNRCVGLYVQVAFLDSPPDQLPNLVIGSYHHMDLFINGKKKRYFVKDAFGFDAHYKNYFAPIGKDKVISGKDPVIWCVENEQKIFDIGGVANVKMAKYNPCTGIIALSTGGGICEPSEYTFLDKNLQVVMTTPCYKFGTSLYHHMQWIDEHHLVQLGSSGTLITDLRMLKPQEHYLDKTVLSPFYGSLALEANAQKSLATVWDLKSRLWESVIVLPEDVRETAATNSRYAVFSTNQTGRLCVLDWQ